MFELQKDFSNVNVQKTIRFTEELDARLKATSEEYHISYNKLVLQCCQYALDNLNSGKEKAK